jgi:membrane-associated phospholipid phosphatase
MCCLSSPSFDLLALSWLSAMAEIGFAASLIVVALAVLWARGHSRLVLCWGAGMTAALAVGMLFKWTMADDAFVPHFPSGHVVLAVVFYGGLILLLLPRSAALATVLLVLGGVALAQGMSRVVLTEHGWMDVAGGFVIGLSGLTLTGNPWSWSGITGQDRLWLGASLAAGAPFAWVAYPDVDPLIRGLAGV